MSLMAILSLGCSPEAVDAVGRGDRVVEAEAVEPAECVLAPELFGSLSTEDTWIGTVLRVYPEGESEVEGLRVSWVDAIGVRRELPLDESALVRGLRPGSEVDLQLLGEVDGRTLCSEPEPFPVGYLRGGLPGVVVEHTRGTELEPGFVSVPLLTAGGQIAVVYDTVEGEVLWAWEVAQQHTQGTPVYLAELRRDGEGILVMTHAPGNRPGNLVWVDWAAEEVRMVSVPALHTDLVQLEDGAVAVLTWQTRRFPDGSLWRGDGIAVVYPDGRVEEVWNLFDDYPHGLGEGVIQEVVDSPEVQELAHVNGLSYDAAEEAWLLSVGDWNSVLKVDRASGELIWELGASGGDFEPPEGEPLMEMPHSVVPLGPEALLIFSRGDVDSCAKTTEVHLDLDQGRAETTWEVVSNPCLFVPFLGNAERLASGDTLVDYSASGQIDIYGPTGVRKWRLLLDLGAGFGFARHLEGLGTAE